MAGLLRLVAMIACALVALGFTTFAADEANKGSEEQVAKVDSEQLVRPDPSPADERAREAAHGSVRELVDDANDVLLAPFAGIVNESAGIWPRRLLPTALALLAYGLGLALLANYLPQRKRESHDWRTA